MNDSTNSNEKYIGLGLAVLSSALIGSSFVITKIGLTDAARANGVAAGDSYSYLKNFKWWLGLGTMIAGEAANFAAYSFAPAILVTPLGALSVLIGAVLASFFLKETLGREGYLGCALCLIGTVIIVMHAPAEQQMQSVDEIMEYVCHPAFVIYSLFVVTLSCVLIFKVSPIYGKRYMIVYISICSLVGSLSVMAVKAFGVAIKLTLSGSNQLNRVSTYFFIAVVIVSALTQINYFNKALGLFSSNLVTPVYYVMFTSATILASLILFRSAGSQSTTVEIITSLCGFLVTLIGVFLLNVKPITRKSFSAPFSNPDIMLSDKNDVRASFIDLPSPVMYKEIPERQSQEHLI